MVYGVVGLCVVVVSVVVVVCCVSRVSGVCPVLCVVVCCRDLSSLCDVGDHGGCVQCVVVVVRDTGLCVLFVSFCLCVSV